MSPKIKKLSPHEAQKIAAGEVVERPANVVKELLENAVDASATHLSLYVEDGGKQLIRVVDDGCGMGEEDAQLCFEHHATSKIETVDDLETISTFGFRGEALSSISSVSNITLITKTADSEGIKVELKAGKIKNKESVSANTGTDISVRDLFFNVPARKKFLKKKETEWRHIQQLFTAFCFDYTNIHFKLFSENKQIFNCPPVENTHERFTQLKDHQVAEHMIPLVSHDEKNGVKITGLISNHQFFRYDRSSIYFFVNHRWVKDFKLSNAFLKGYLNVAPPGKYPAGCIFITVDPHEIDINIHPRKEEIQFLHPRRVQHLLKETVKKTLENHLSKQLKKDVRFTSAYAYPGIPARQASADRPSFISNENYAHSKTFSSVFVPNQTSPISAATPAFPSEQQTTVSQPTPSAQTEKNYRLIGQFKKTYLLLEKEEGLFVVDQHAAHERILYEQFSKRFEDVESVKLLFPQTITLTAQDISLAEPHLKLFQKNGIQIEPFSDTQLVVHTTPVHLKNASIEELVREALGWIIEFKNLDEQEFVRAMNKKLHAQMACKAAVKAGDTLTEEKIHQLLNDLYTTENRFTCPHGRPTSWLLSTYEIEKKFKRKL